ncbi:MAG: FtsQ-type POTRA domain-containing protein [Oscillospiraceae bacterium]|jgi:cell division protein FtsQ|nr:FtsQ-type POTRA domain-containing protein [Oscillospiraceae bacterium]MCI8758092.1 FtsQ-type POTRA domain-containing protein [Oscillospiraceae bacterium]
MPKKRKTRRRRRRGGLGRLLRPLSVLLTAVAVVAALTMFFKVSTVEVTGSSRYRDGEVAAASGVELGDNLVLLDKYRIAQRIYTELPYVTEARINRKFPSTLVLEVTETTAVASIQGAGGYWLLSAGEKLLEAVDETGAQDYLRITGLEAVNPAVSARLELPEDSPITLERLGQLLSAMERLEMLGRADGLDLSDRSDLVLGYDGRFQVIISYDADFDYKLLCLLEAVKCLEPNERGTIRLNMKEANKAHFIPASE